jgi:ketosteroid isomerase-like protein
LRVIRAIVSPLMLCGAAASAQQPPATSAVTAQIAALEHRIERAVVDTDTLYLDSAYAQGFQFKHATGELQNRATWLQSVRAARGRFLSRDVDSLDVEVHGDMALTTGRIHVRRLRPDGTTVEYTIRYVRMYAFRNGRWQLLTHHSTQQTAGPPLPP